MGRSIPERVAQRTPRTCRDCPRLARSNVAGLCEECHRKAKRQERVRERDSKRKRVAERRAARFEMPEPPFPPIVDASGARVDSKVFPRVPARPLGLAVSAVIRDHTVGIHSEGGWACLLAESGAKVDPFQGFIEAICEGLGTSERSYREWVKGGRAYVSFNLADKVITNAGLLWFDVWNPTTVQDRAELDRVCAIFGEVSAVDLWPDLERELEEAA